jgi:hypothetical protein
LLHKTDTSRLRAIFADTGPCAAEVSPPDPGVYPNNGVALPNRLWHGELQHKL